MVAGSVAHYSIIYYSDVSSYNDGIFFEMLDFITFNQLTPIIIVVSASAILFLVETCSYGDTADKVCICWSASALCGFPADLVVSTH